MKIFRKICILESIKIFQYDFNAQFNKSEIGINLSKEVKNCSILHHQSIVQYMKFSPCSFNQTKKPMIITEYVSNGTLESILEVERKQTVPFWDDTYKLITIYGIASAMKYIQDKFLNNLTEYLVNGDLYKILINE